MESNNDVTLPEEQQRQYSSKHRRHSGRRRRKRSPIRKALRWVRKNPNKTIAVILAAVIIYVTYLFVMYALEHPRKRDITSLVQTKNETTPQEDVKILIM